MTTPEQPDTLLEFPCQYPVKVMGESHADFSDLVVKIIRRHADDVSDNAVRTRQSSGGKYSSVTVTITATSKAQLDAIYQDLTAEPRVKYAL
ncbi:putative lipoate regulatory protein YbeD [Methylophaga frappieri]|uniref:UPF0250 protein Q7C_1169 n=1 Tax=Methylophaga frappieri (strain ATCC BAA-2434 / DSM 25690 / JAM7) TaxID=754477 RepID=I1YHD1_METFJ|nr:DUF493 domain-containing protein [Methylophaga frappieri]AFJ02324.1 putative lipoate regulatory protein YbeD [Methylophaga frappieri]